MTLAKRPLASHRSCTFFPYRERSHGKSNKTPVFSKEVQLIQIFCIGAACPASRKNLTDFRLGTNMRRIKDRNAVTIVIREDVIAGDTLYWIVC